MNNNNGAMIYCEEDKKYGLRSVIYNEKTGKNILQLIKENKRNIIDIMNEFGAILFRVSGATDARSFEEAVKAFEFPLLSYEFGSTPRTALGDGVYTSTEYPAHSAIPLHNEQSYTREWGMWLWLFCERPPASGGETPIADSRKIYRGVDSAVREEFTARKLMYVRNYGGGLDVPWQKVFNTDDPDRVEAYCRPRRIVCEWKPDGELRTRQICQAVERHPETGDLVWFNQAHLFHVSALASDVRDALLDVVDEDDLPRNVYFGDGAPLDEASLSHIRAIYAQETVAFPWRAGDILMLDNMLSAHGRAPFTGDRKVLVAMARPHSNLNDW